MKNKMRVAFVILLSALSTLHSMAQNSNLPYEAVYSTENQSLALILKRNGNYYSGYLVSNNGNQKLTATEDALGMLTLASVENPDLKSIGTLDEYGNLTVMDQDFSTFYLIRTQISVDAALKELHGGAATSANTAGTTPANTDSQTPKPPAPKGTLSPKYAGLKFMHLYTGNGLSEKWSYFLYQTGEFKYVNYTNYSSSSGGDYFSYASKDANTGTWAIHTENGVEYLMLVWANGNQSQLRIQKTNDGYLLNNETYYLVDLDR